MIVVRECFVAKPGNASKLAAQFKDAATTAAIRKWRVLTDLTGDFNRVVLEHEVDNLGDLETEMKDYRTNEALREKLKGYTELYITGTREIFQIV